MRRMLWWVAVLLAALWVVALIALGVLAGTGPA